MRRKPQIRTLLILGIAFLLATGGTVAYFVTSETAHNIVSTSGVGIGLYDFAGPEGSPSLDESFEVTPGVTYSKIPYVENLDTESVWVRIRLTLTKKSGDAAAVPIDNPTSLLEFGEFGAHWSYSDGYYYYDSPLASGESTEPIFRSIKFISDTYNGELYTLSLTADATQVKHNGSSALEAVWTEEGA